MRIPRVIIVDYDPDWPALYEEEKTLVLEAIGHKILAIEHVGSTAVPGLGAKPIIDMMAGMQESSDAEQCIALLRKIGYTSFTPDPENKDHYYCCGKGPHSIGYHLHLIKYESDEWNRHLLFRDYLRNNPEIATQYHDLKRNLGSQYHSDRGGYTAAKTSFIDFTIAKASSNYEKVNSILVSEANTILHDYGLIEILEKYGKPDVIGSYALNLMTWRDLDIHVENNEMNIQTFFNLGYEIAKKLKPHRMSFRNEHIGRTKNLPSGLYWGIYTNLTFPETWKIDIWIMDSKQNRLFSKKFQDLKSQLTKENKQIIMRIKDHYCKHPEYRKKFVSMDIYNAVIEDNINSIKDFSNWLERNRGIILRN